MNKPSVFSPQIHEGQAVKIIGLGGTGGILARYGAMFLASLHREARLVLVDGDQFEEGNATRMFFGRHGNKAAVVREELLPRLAPSLLTVVAVEEYVTATNLTRLIHEGDIVLLAVDNHATRKLVSDHCARLEDVCLISGGNDGVGPDSAGLERSGTYGNVQIFLRAAGRELSPSLTQLHPELQNPADRSPADQSCTELMASVPQLLFANLAVASAMLNALWLHLAGALPYAELALDIAEGRMLPVLEMPRMLSTPAHSMTVPARPPREALPT